jgi:1-aminocyclopropane-1-carboxylate deaminase/D-cysteine desulfhydrase-like pyridoxal-dependent ACC family enzyme
MSVLEVPPLTVADLRRRIDALPRFHLTDLPTPLQETPNLRKALGGPRVLIKRDDLTHSALGGNKNRKFEFEIAEALHLGCDVVVWGGGVRQSNHARQCAAAARKAALDIVLVLNRGVHGDDRQGNRLLTDLLGAEVHQVDSDEMFGVDAELQRVEEDLRTAGRKPYVIRYGPLTAVGYVECLIETVEQANALGAGLSHVYVASGGGTQAGLELCARALGLDVQIRGFTPLRVPGGRASAQARMANMTAGLLGLDITIDPTTIFNSEAYIGTGYAEITPEGVEAIKLLARTEGVFLEPVYTAKAFAALLGDIRSGSLTEQDAVAFIHTGGTPLLFAYAEELSPA